MWEENNYLQEIIEKLEEELDRKRYEMIDNDKRNGLLTDLFENEIIDEDGTVVQKHND